jgi:hypothetical protein
MSRRSLRVQFQGLAVGELRYGALSACPRAFSDQGAGVKTQLALGHQLTRYRILIGIWLRVQFQYRIHRD